MALYVIAYAGLCVLVAYLGRAREIGFAGFLVLSVILTPLVTALVLLISGPRQHQA